MAPPPFQRAEEGAYQCDLLAPRPRSASETPASAPSAARWNAPGASEHASSLRPRGGASQHASALEGRAMVANSRLPSPLAGFDHHEVEPKRQVRDRAPVWQRAAVEQP